MPGTERSVDLVLDGMIARFTAGPAAGVPPLRLAVQAFLAEPLDGHADVMRWLALCPVVQSLAVFELWDDEAFAALATRAVRLAREAGALTTLPVALVYLSGVHLFAGEFTAAAAQIQEAEAITAATGNAGLVHARLLLGAWRGAEAEAKALIDSNIELAVARGEGRVVALAGYATGVLNNGLGHYEAALAGAQRGCEDDDQGYAGESLGELVEAAVRAGRPELAGAALPRLEARAHAAGTDWALGFLARARALVSDDEALYREAIERLSHTRMRVELARAQLVYGEWLRRESRRVDAREQLRPAYEAFAAFGAEAYAERARRELVATGETVQRRTAETRDVLTPQESPDRAPRRRRAHQPGDRRPAVHQPADRRVPPAQGLRQARRQLAQGALRGVAFLGGQAQGGARVVGEQFLERLELAVLRRREERVEQAGMRGGIELPAPVARQPAACARDDLADVGLAEAEHLCDPPVWIVERLAQDVDGALGGGEALEQHLQRQGEVVALFGAERRVGVRVDRLGRPGAGRRLAPDARRLPEVEREAHRRGGQERGRFADDRAVGLLPAHPRVLHDVVGVVGVHQHATGDPQQPRTVLDEGDGVCVGHAVTARSS